MELKAHSLRLQKKTLAFALIPTFIFGLAMSVGHSIDKTGELELKSASFWIMFLAAWLVAALFLFFLLCLCDQESSLCDQERKPSKKLKSRTKTGLGSYLLTCLLLFLCWIPVFLAEYPGFFVYDATDEYVEVATRTFNTHHPLLHVLMLGGSVCGGNKLFGSINVGIAIYTVFQMTVMAAIFAWIVNECKTRCGYVLSLLWYGFFPTVVMFVLCSAKDTLFVAALLVSVILTTKLFNEFKLNHLIVLALSLCLMMLFRNNGVYAFLVYAVVVCVYVTIHADKARRLKTALLLVGMALAILATYKITDAVLVSVTRASDIENQEILTVPIQQVARTWSVYRDEMNQEELDTLYEVLPENVLAHYTPNLSDPVKVGFDNEMYARNPAKYRKLWWDLFKKHSGSYLNAWLNTCVGFFYPGTVVNVYAGHEVYTFTYTESSYFGYEVEYPGERVSIIPIIDRFYRWISLDDDIQKTPILHLLFSMGAMFWLYVLFAIVLLYKKRGNEILVGLTLPGAVWLTLLLGPTYLPRYTVFLWFMLPWIIKEVYAVCVVQKENC